MINNYFVVYSHFRRIYKRGILLAFLAGLHYAIFNKVYVPFEVKEIQQVIW